MNLYFVLKEATVSQRFSTDVELWRECKSFQLSMVRRKRMNATYEKYRETMSWLDEVLVTAKSQFSK